MYIVAGVLVGVQQTVSRRLDTCSVTCVCSPFVHTDTSKYAHTQT